MNRLTEERTCSTCGNEFVAEFHRGTWPAHCPSCNDLRQRKPSIVADRHVLAGPFVCRVESLPGDWEELRTPDGSKFKLTIKGDAFGASWTGRIDIFAQHPFRPGDVVAVSEVQVAHTVAVQRTGRPTSGFTQLRGGPAQVEQRQVIPLNQITDELREAEGFAVEVEQRTYIRMDDAHGADPGTRRLVTLLAASKVTMKGYGRQYRHAFTGVPVWEKRVSGGVRSGRIENTLVLAIVDDEHPLEVVTVFDFQGGKPDRQLDAALRKIDALEERAIGDVDQFAMIEDEPAEADEYLSESVLDRLDEISRQLSEDD